MADLNLNIETGEKTFTINEDPNKLIKFNLTDMNIITRFNEASKVISKSLDDLKGDISLNPDGTPEDETEEISKIIKKIDKTMREQIDYIFGYPVSDVVFGGTNPLASVGGISYCERFINAALPFIEKEIQKESKASEKRVSKYTAKYHK